ncbi:hypothetical protein XBKQ1_1160001 [Xenorhabdus bovienii str. kraussei Quebec]|uniref:Uncharacterized protein n=1 Tax=Xenorhabdus bovienii str. kraussei Quebec TaxID=1398203 RepID=A0A077PCA0_XENBV|nr:hypothetical protein XBKQ1_1160001 [Xenorhabdus bovienii str. kraussei Quebec]
MSIFLTIINTVPRHGGDKPTEYLSYVTKSYVPRINGAALKRVT